MPKQVAIDLIDLDGCQSRVTTDEETIADYAEKWRAGAKFPPVDLFHDGADYFPGDGIHRILGGIEADLDTIPANVRKGSQRDARLFAAGANQTHGLKRTNADKRKSVETVLELEPKWSDRRIAEHCGVGHQLVAHVRSQVDDSSTCDEPTERVGKDGKTYKAKPTEPVDDDLPPELAGKPKKISGGTSFDPEELEAAPAKKKPKQGSATVASKDRKDCIATISKLVKQLDRMGIYDEFVDPLSQIIQRVKSA